KLLLDSQRPQMGKRPARMSRIIHRVSDGIDQVRPVQMHIAESRECRHDGNEGITGWKQAQRTGEIELGKPQSSGPVELGEEDRCDEVAGNDKENPDAKIPQTLQLQKIDK